MRSKEREKSSLFIFALSLTFFLLIHTSRGWCEALVKIGFADVQKIIIESNEGKKAKKQLEDFHSKRQKEIDAFQEEVMKLEMELQSQRFTLNEEALDRKEQEVQRKKVDLKRLVEDSERELDNMEKKLFKEIKDDVDRIIKQIGESEGFTIIFGNTIGSVLYFNPAIDITYKVIDQYNRAKASSTKP